MKVLKEGKIESTESENDIFNINPNTKVLCGHCDCEFEVDKYDTVGTTIIEGIQYPTVKCPTCGKEIAVLPNNKEFNLDKAIEDALIEFEEVHSYNKTSIWTHLNMIIHTIHYCTLSQDVDYKDVVRNEFTDDESLKKFVADLAKAAYKDAKQQEENKTFFTTYFDDNGTVIEYHGYCSSGMFEVDCCIEYKNGVHNVTVFSIEFKPFKTEYWG